MLSSTKSSLVMPQAVILDTGYWLADAGYYYINVLRHAGLDPASFIITPTLTANKSFVMPQAVIPGTGYWLADAGYSYINILRHAGLDPASSCSLQH